MKMVYSKAYQDLNAPSLKILSYLLLQLRWVKVGRKTKRYSVSNKDEIKLLYSTFTKDPFKMHPQTISRSIDSLLEHGFVKIKKQGGKVKGDNSVYEYSEKWEDWVKGLICFSRRPYHRKRFQKRCA